MLYIERPPVESRCYEEICKPGVLLRIQAPLQFGKTELMSRIMHHAAQQGYRTVVLNLRDAVDEDFNSLYQIRFSNPLLTQAIRNRDYTNKVRLRGLNNKGGIRSGFGIR
ncbi:AAA-like domain-containing protein [Brasilonema sp. CT11]|nr:AAA-like domain-containing protein [Brasilonema sp. CT11]